MSATPKQRAYIETLAREVRTPVPHVETFEEASATIEDLLKQCPIREGTSRAVHAMLKGSHWTRENLKLAVGADSFSPAKGCSEAQGQMALKLLKGEQVEVRRPAPAATFVEQLAADERKPPRRPMRPLTNPHRQPAGPEVTVREPPAPATRPADVPGIRMPRRPGRPVPQQTAPAAPRRIVLMDPGHEAAMDLARQGIAPVIQSLRAPQPSVRDMPLVRSVLEQYPGAEIVAVHVGA